MQFKDQLNRTIFLDKTPDRIVSLVPSQTELLVDLGLEDQLVGITKFCVHPVDLRQKVEVVGGTKQVHIEKIKHLKPNIIICNKEENTLKMVMELGQIAPVWISDIYDINDSLKMISDLGDIFNVVSDAAQLRSDIIAEMEEFNKFIKNKPVKNVAYLIWKDPLMCAGKNTFIDSMLSLNKFENINDIENGRYPEVTFEHLLKADKILLSSEPYPFKQKDVVRLKADLKKEIYLVDGEYFSWYGSRLKKAFSYFKSLH